MCRLRTLVGFWVFIEYSILLILVMSVSSEGEIRCVSTEELVLLIENGPMKHDFIAQRPLKELKELKAKDSYYKDIVIVLPTEFSETIDDATVMCTVNGIAIPSNFAYQDNAIYRRFLRMNQCDWFSIFGRTCPSCKECPCVASTADIALIIETEREKIRNKTNDGHVFSPSEAARANCQKIARETLEEIERRKRNTLPLCITDRIDEVFPQEGT